MPDAAENNGIEESTTLRKKCIVRDGSFVDPCWVLEMVAEPYGTRAKGVSREALSKASDDGSRFVPSRSWFKLKSGSDKRIKNGISLNYCPFCGTCIDEPFNRPTANSESQP